MKIDVLDKGYIELVDTLGDDLTPVNAARVSFGGRSDKFENKDRKLSKFLIKHKHFSPFRHQHIQVIIKAPETSIISVRLKIFSSLLILIFPAIILVVAQWETWQ